MSNKNNSKTIYAAFAMVLALMMVNSVEFGMAQCTGAPCEVDPVNHCRSAHGFCGGNYAGGGDAWCNENSLWTPGCGSSSMPPSTPPVVEATAVPSRRPSLRQTSAPTTTPPTTTPPTTSGSQNGQGCTGAPCGNPTHCRSKWGFCGLGEGWCNAEAIWTPACASGGTSNPTSPPSVATPPPSVATPPPTNGTPPPSTVVTQSPSVTTLPPSSNPPTSQPPSAPPAPSPASHEVISYFTEWGIYGRDFKIKDIHTKNQAGSLTILNYAFGNVYKKADGTIQCDASITKAESGQGDGGDQFAAYGKGFSAQDSVDGVADSWNAPLKGNFNQILKLKQLYPNLKVLISLGGWSWSRYFSEGSMTAESRRILVESCVDQYVKGNLPQDTGTNAGGAGSGLGVFDGIDVDWEYPSVQGVGYNTVSADDRANHVELFKEFRRQLDEYGAEVGKSFLLTTAIGAGADKIAGTDPEAYSQYANLINVMTYDYQGAWASSGPTDFQSNLFADNNGPNFALTPESNTHSAIQALLNANVDPAKICLGIPFYGRGWTGVPAGPDSSFPGLYQSATGAARGTYENGFEDYKVLRNAAGTVYNHGPTEQSYKYDGTTFWSYDTPENIERKIQYIKQYNLGGIFSWSLDGDYNNELTLEMAKVNN